MTTTGLAAPGCVEGAGRWPAVWPGPPGGAFEFFSEEHPAAKEDILQTVAVEQGANRVQAAGDEGE